MATTDAVQLHRVWLIAIILVFSQTAFGCDVKERFHKTVQLSKSLGAGKQFEAGTHNGSIRAVGRKTPMCEITAKITGRGPTVQDAEKVAESITIKFDTDMVDSCQEKKASCQLFSNSSYHG